MKRPAPVRIFIPNKCTIGNSRFNVYCMYMYRYDNCTIIIDKTIVRNCVPLLENDQMSYNVYILLYSKT